MQNHDVFLYSNQVEYRHQTLGHISETYSASHLAYNKHTLLSADETTKEINK